MARRSCDGDGLLDAFRAAVANLEAHVDEVNGLNVYPVPDGDTGSNMYATVKAALDEAEAVAGEPAERVAAAISFGALMGARGNSGRHHQPDLPRHGRGPRRQEAVQRARPGPRADRGREDRLRGRREARRGHDPDGHPRVGRRGGRGSRARRRHRDRPRRDRRRGREVGREDPEPPGDPARGRRRRLGRPGPLSALPGRAPAPDVGRRRPAAARDQRHRRPEAVHARRPRGRGVRLRDDVPAPGRRRRDRSTSTRSATTSSRSASPSSSPATRAP